MEIVAQPEVSVPIHAGSRVTGYLLPTQAFPEPERTVPTPFGLRKAVRLVILVSLIVLLPTAMQGMPGSTHAANNQDVYLYLHRLPGNVSISGIQTKEILNATTLWNAPSLTPNLRYVAYNFSLYPALASSLQAIGAGSIDLWITVNGAPGLLNATIYELNSAGNQAVVSSSTAITNSTDPNTPYLVAVSFNLNHTFSPSSTIKLSLSATRVAQAYLWYDSTAYPSGIRFPALNVPRVTLIETFDSALKPQTSFRLDQAQPDRVVFASVHVADPFGAYHVSSATVSILAPGSAPIYTVAASALSASPGSPEKIFGLNWAYDQNLQPGNYTISALAYDKSGNQASGAARFILSSGTTSPGGPSGGVPLDLITFLLALAIASGIIGFFLYSRGRKTKCPKCGVSIPRQLNRCPKCGADIANPTSEAR